VYGGVALKETFLAYVVRKEAAQTRGGVETLRADQLPAGEVTVAVE
jgi:hypothetical protein